MSFLRSVLRVVLPLAVVAVGALAARWLAGMRAEPEIAPREVIPPLVLVVTAESTDARLVVHTQGTVVPRTQSRLVAEVAGRVTWVSPLLVNGGFFEEGDELLRIDDVDYHMAVEQARVEVARAQLKLAQEEADAEVARRDWEQLGRGEGNPLVFREPHLAEARAELAASQARLEQTERDVERCTLVAPYAGRVRSESVDAGQYLTRGAEIAQIYAVDWAEVRLPLPDAELAYLSLPLVYRDGEDDGHHPKVVLSASFAGGEYEWEGEIVRTEGELDPRTRMVTAVARVEDPYGRGEVRDQPPLAVGMFVRAEIQGRQAAGAVVLPRSALRGKDVVLLADADDRLRFRTVGVLKAERERVILSGGVAAGERVIVSPLESAVDGMRVRVRDADE